MELANVPTIDSLRDSSTYRCESGIPVFRPHVRHALDVNGQPTDRVKYAVTDDDLEEICQNSNATVERDCHFPRSTIGHVNFKPNCPEHAQPAKWTGYAVNYRVGVMPAGDKVILADIYTHRDFVEECRGYPYRSAEYNWKSKRIGGVARILRDPALGLGTTPYQDDDSYTCYAEAVMTPDPSAGNPMSGGDLNPDEAVLADRLWSYFAAKYPGLASAAAGSAPTGPDGLPEGDQKPEPEESEDEQREKAEGEESEDDDEEESVPGKSPVAKPKKKKKPSEDDDVSKNAEGTVTVEMYQASQDEVKTLRASLATKDAEVQKAKVAVILDQLEKVEHYEFDRAEVETEMLALDEAGRTKKAENIRKFNKKTDGGAVQVLEGNVGVSQLPGSETAGGMSAAKFDLAVKWQAANPGKTWADALIAVK